MIIRCERQKINGYYLFLLTTILHIYKDDDPLITSHDSSEAEQSTADRKVAGSNPARDDSL